MFDIDLMDFCRFIRGSILHKKVVPIRDHIIGDHIKENKERVYSYVCHGYDHLVSFGRWGNPFSISYFTRNSPCPKNNRWVWTKMYHNTPC